MIVYSLEDVFQFAIIGMVSGIFIGSIACVIGMTVGGIIKIFNKA